VRVSAAGNRKGWGAQVAVSLHDGRRYTGALETFAGCPETPLSDDQLRFKFDRLLKDASAKATLFDDLTRIEELPSLAGYREE
jgi:hypothetical protein